MNKITYTPSNLPPVKNGTAGHLRPKDEGTVAACLSPILVDLPFPANWGKPIGATMPVPAGGFITCLAPGDAYYNREFLMTSSLTGKVLDPAVDPRAAELDSFFGAKGLKVLVVEAKKTVGVEVIGEVADEAVGHDLLTAEGVQTLGAADTVVRSPRTGDVYRFTPANRAKRYAESGHVFDGALPPEYR